MNPSERTNSQPPVRPYETPNSRLSTARTRAIEQRSVGNPACYAPRGRIPRSDSSCSASSRFGRPKSLALSLPNAPLISRRCRAQVLVLCRDTPNRRASSVSVIPRASRRAPWSRRCSDRHQIPFRCHVRSRTIPQSKRRTNYRVSDHSSIGFLIVALRRLQETELSEQLSPAADAAPWSEYRLEPSEPATGKRRAAFVSRNTHLDGAPGGRC